MKLSAVLLSGVMPMLPMNVLKPLFVDRPSEHAVLDASS
jgi:hypothetical protein